MKTVTIEKTIYGSKEINVPEGVFKEEKSDYQDGYKEKYFKYYYLNKKGVKKECNIKYV